MLINNGIVTNQLGNKLAFMQWIFERIWWSNTCRKKILSKKNPQNFILVVFESFLHNFKLVLLFSIFDIELIFIEFAKCTLIVAKN